MVTGLFAGQYNTKSHGTITDVIYVNEMYQCPCINRNARPYNNQSITYFLHFCYFLRIQQYPVNTAYNTKSN